MQGAYHEAMTESPLVKAADKLSAYVKCIAERRAGNDEFLAAEKQTREALERMGLDEVDYFLRRFIPAFEKSLDEFDMI
jgi:5'-deoxynucleotidase